LKSLQGWHCVHPLVKITSYIEMPIDETTNILCLISKEYVGLQILSVQCVKCWN
jgi:hypothetical protein